MFLGIDFSSDTVTRPTIKMRQVMCHAEVGDEQRGEDPTTLNLEEKIALLLGKSAATFLPSATMANEIAIRLHCDHGDELIADAECHLFAAEAGGPAIHSGVQARPIYTQNGIFSGEAIRKVYRELKSPHYPISKLVSVENTTNLAGGIAWQKKELTDVLETAKSLGLKTHLDGARFFNAVIATGISAKELASPFDTVTVCLSKGLGCPIGAVLLFSDNQKTKVRRLKQLMGGAMRQSGILAAAGIYALDHHVQRLEEDHANARSLANGLGNYSDFFEIENPIPSTNMVFFKLKYAKVSDSEFSEACLRNGLRFSRVGINRFRAVTHLDTDSEKIKKAILSLQPLTAELKH